MNRKLSKYFTILLLGAAALFPTSSRADDNAVKDEYLGLSLGLLQAKISNATGNFVLSPFSVYMATDLLANGADGQTLEKLQKMILSPRHNLSVADINQDLGKYMQNISPAVKINNSVWGNQFKPEYIKTVEALAAEAHDLPQNTQVINDWVSEKTEGKIKDIVPLTTPAPDDLYLVNTVYFNDKWANTFDIKETEVKPFYNLEDKQPTDIYMMHKHYMEYSQYYENEQFQAVRLWYESYSIPKEGVDTQSLEATTDFNNSIDYPANYIDLILPKRNVDFKGFVRNLRMQNIKIPYGKYDDVELDLYLPRFEIDYKTPLKQWFRAGGIPLSRDDEGVDFSAMSDAPHYVSNIIHQANIRVDEKGTEAAAATAIMVATYGISRSPKPKVLQHKIFNADRPFIFVINDGLFIGAFINGMKLEPSDR